MHQISRFYPPNLWDLSILLDDCIRQGFKWKAVAASQATTVDHTHSTPETHFYCSGACCQNIGQFIQELRLIVTASSCCSHCILIRLGYRCIGWPWSSCKGGQESRQLPPSPPVGIRRLYPHPTPFHINSVEEGEVGIGHRVPHS